MASGQPFAFFPGYKQDKWLDNQGQKLSLWLCSVPYTPVPRQERLLYLPHLKILFSMPSA